MSSFRVFGVLTLSFGAVFFVGGCSSNEPLSPAEAARAKVRFMRQHGTVLDDERSALIRQIPYTPNREQFNRRLQRVLVEGKAGVTFDESRLGERRRTLNRKPEDIYVIVDDDRARRESEEDGD